MTDIELRSPVTDAELRAWYDPLATAFSEDFSEEEITAEQPFMERERLISAFDGKRRIGSSGAFSMELTVPGGSIVKASGITGVGVLPDERRRGVLRRMMRWLLDDAAKRKEPVAILWASEAAIYQRFGFGMSTLVSSFEVDRARVVFREPLAPRDDVRVRMVDVEEGTRLAMRVYDQMRQRVPGSLDREELEWTRFLMGDPAFQRGKDGLKYRIVVEVGGKVRGYAVFRVNDEWANRGPTKTVMVLEALALDPEAEQVLWQWLGSMDLATNLAARRGPVPHPLQLRLLEPRRLGLMVGDGLWLRIVDVAGALAARSYAGEGSVVLELTDDFVPANAGRWRLRVRADGAVTVKPTTRKPDLSMDIAALACVYLGAWRFADLAATGRVVEHRKGAVRAADVLVRAGAGALLQHDVLASGEPRQRHWALASRSPRPSHRAGTRVDRSGSRRLDRATRSRLHASRPRPPTW